MAEPTEPAASAGAKPPNDGGAVRPEKPSDAMADGPAEDTGGSPGIASRTESGELALPESAGLATVTPAAGGTKNISWPRLARADYQPGPDSPPAPSRSVSNPYRLWMWVAAQGCGFGLLLGGYFLGQAWAPRQRSEPARADNPKTMDTASRSQRAGSERALDAANRALKAERGHDFQAARAIYDDMAKRQTPLVGAEYRLALISLHEGDFLQTEAHLNRSLRAEEAVGDCYLLRASLAGMKSNFADASTQLAAAVRAQPFSAKFIFCWGEALRRDGHFPAAVQRLAQALDRPDDAAARALYSFKLRLAKIEEGNDEGFNAELARRLTDPTPGGDWLLLAAAQEIGRKNYPAASLRLEKGKTVLPPEIFSTYLQDYLFQVQRARPELAAILSVPPLATSTPTDGPLEDPAVWTAAEADPAVWPPFATAQ